MKRRAFLKGAAGVGLVTAGGVNLLPGRSSHAAGDTVTVGINNDIVTWDPLSVSEWYTTAILPSVLETTVTNKDGAYIPWLLESIQPREPTVWRMRLRPGIKFHDGEPLDAKALKWNLALYADRSANYPNPGTRVLLPLMKEANIVDDRTVDLVTTQASALVYEGLTRYLGDQWNSVVDADVNTASAAIDQQTPRMGMVHAARQLARTILLGSAPERARFNLRR